MHTKTIRALGRSAAVVVAMLVCCHFMVVAVRAADAAETIDWNRARELMQKSRQGGTLTTDERAFLERAQAARGKGGNPAAVATEITPREKTGLTPLTEMTGQPSYKGRDGGLYGGGKNEPPVAHAKAALVEAGHIVPLDAEGKPSAQGKVALLSVGMSNTTQEYSRFKEIAERDAEKSLDVVIVDGAQGGQAAAQWVTAPDNRVWQTVDARLKSAGVTAAQVQAAWLKQANIRPTQPFPAHAQMLAADLTKLLHLLKQAFPNLRIVYLSSRIYAGYATTALNPEPYAFEGAFAVRDIITRQISGDAELNYDPSKGAVKSPLLLWGPYLWADGLTPRASDGLIWKRVDLREDGTHPSESGRDKVAAMLLAFLKTDRSATPWFVAKRGEGAKK